MPTTIKGKCPACSQELYLEITVLHAPRGFKDQGAAPSAVNSNDGRPTCPTCGLDCKLVEAVAKKAPNAGRSFRGWKCVNSECENTDKFVDFTWLDKQAAA